jgi:nitrite reductase/ring-hydroxylating ferredoxin subunit/thioredoxin reductase
MFSRLNYKKFFIFSYGISALSKKLVFQQEEERVFQQDFKSPKLPKYRVADRPKGLKYNIKEFRSAYLFEDLADLINYNPKKQHVAEQVVYLGDENTIPKNAFIQVDLNRLEESQYTNKMKEFKTEQSQNEDIQEEDPKKYFNKVLVFHYNYEYYATSSFCGYDLTDLKDGVFLGNKIICPTCLSEYNIENGTPEHGPNMRFLAGFPVSLKENKLLLKTPENFIPLFAFHKNMKTLDLDPRHFVLIGDTETTVAAVDSLKKVFSGRISIVNHQTGLDFIDFNKLSKSFFPTKAKHSRWISNQDFEKFKIQLYNDKVTKIDASDKIITLQSGIKMPFDKVLIAVGSERENMLSRYANCFTLNNVIDHANIHNLLVRKEYNNFAVIGNNLRAIEIACSMRRYLDVIGKENARVSLVVHKDWAPEKYGDEDCARIVENYLIRNRIIVFRNYPIGLQPSSDEKKLESIVFKLNNQDYRIPVNMVVLEMGLKQESRCDFLSNILIESEEDEVFSVINRNVITPDGRLSLHTSSRYPYVFTAGSCCAIVSQYFKSQIVRSDNVNTNFHFGFIAALNMLDFHYPFDDIIVDSGKALDRWIHLVGNDVFNSKLVYKNYDKEQFVSYLFNGDKLEGMLVYGFKNLHIFFKEALKLELVPNENFSKDSLKDLHLKIVASVLKNTDKIKCHKHESFNETTTTNTTKYSIEDQKYTNNLMKRSVSAYKFYRDRLNKEHNEHLKKKEEENKKRAQDRLEKFYSNQVSHSDSDVRDEEPENNDNN